MGRHAGFLTASSALLRQNNNDGPHLIYLPEFSFSYQSFLEDIKKTYIKHGKCIIAVSEGIQNKKKNLFLRKYLKLKNMMLMVIFNYLDQVHWEIFSSANKIET